MAAKCNTSPSKHLANATVCTMFTARDTNGQGAGGESHTKKSRPRHPKLNHTHTHTLNNTTLLSSLLSHAAQAGTRTNKHTYKCTSTQPVTRLRAYSSTAQQADRDQRSKQWGEPRGRMQRQRTDEVTRNLKTRGTGGGADVSA